MNHPTQDSLLLHENSTVLPLLIGYTGLYPIPCKFHTYQLYYDGGECKDLLLY